jgi:putative hydrolase of the HAD superfamily
MGTNYDSRVRSVIAGLPGLAPLQDRVVVSAAIGFRKPAPEFFQEVARTMGCEPRHVLFVGDDVENDFEGASAAGMEAVLLDPRGQSTLPRRIERLRELSA